MQPLFKVLNQTAFFHMVFCAPPSGDREQQSWALQTCEDDTSSHDLPGVEQIIWPSTGSFSSRMLTKQHKLLWQAGPQVTLSLTQDSIVLDSTLACLPHCLVLFPISFPLKTGLSGGCPPGLGSDYGFYQQGKLYWLDHFNFWKKLLDWQYAPFLVFWTIWKYSTFCKVPRPHKNDIQRTQEKRCWKIHAYVASQSNSLWLAAATCCRLWSLKTHWPFSPFGLDLQSRNENTVCWRLNKISE